MKNSVIKIVIFLIGLGFTFKASAAANDANIPDQVTAAFIAQHPQAQLKDWKMTNAGYKAEFILNHRECIAVYAPDGTLIKSETKLGRIKDIPFAVRTALRNGKYAAYYVDEIKVVNTPAETHYVLIIDNHSGSSMASEGYGAWEDYRIVFDNSGSLTDVKAL